MNTFTTLDYCVFIAYVILIIVVGLFTSRTGGKKEKDSKEYFLAGNS